MICALLRDFREHGQKAIAKVRQTQPAAYLKICALLVPKEMKLEHSGGVKDLTDEELEQAIAAIKAMLATQAGEAAKVIEATAEAVPALPRPTRRKAKQAESAANDHSSDSPDGQGEGNQ